MNTFITKFTGQTTVCIVLLLILTGFSHAAKKPIVTANEDSFASQACAIAANQGLSSVRRFSNENNVNYYEVKRYLTCNGKNIEIFAKQFKQATAKNTKVMSSDNSVLSQVCIDALSIGKTQALKKHELSGYSVNCNEVSISTFVEQLSNSETKVVASNILAKSE